MDVIAVLANYSLPHSTLASGTFGISAGQTVLLVLGVIGLTIVMRSTYRRVGRSKGQPRSSARDVYADLQEQSAAKRDVEHVMLELDQLARQIHGRIDTRFAKLEAVIRDADDRIEKLSRLMKAADGAPTVDITLEHEDPHDVRQCDSEDAGGPHAAIYRLADGGLQTSDIAREVSKTTGEIELILALRKTKREADRTFDPVPLSSSDPRG
jgi:hypothetical protein